MVLDPLRVLLELFVVVVIEEIVAILMTHVVKQLQITPNQTTYGQMQKRLLGYAGDIRRDLGREPMATSDPLFLETKPHHGLSARSHRKKY